MIEPGYHQRTEQGIVGGIHLVIADAVEQRAIDEFRPDKPELALAQARKHPVVCCGFIVELEKRHACLVLLNPSVPPLDEQPNLLGITAAAHHLDALPLTTHFLHDAHRGATRFVQLLLDKHATKVVIFLETGAAGGELSGGYPLKIGLSDQTG